MCTYLILFLYLWKRRTRSPDPLEDGPWNQWNGHEHDHDHFEDERSEIGLDRPRSGRPPFEARVVEDIGIRLDGQERFRHDHGEGQDGSFPRFPDGLPAPGAAAPRHGEEPAQRRGSFVSEVFLALDRHVPFPHRPASMERHRLRLVLAGKPSAVGTVAVVGQKRFRVDGNGDGAALAFP